MDDTIAFNAAQLENVALFTGRGNDTVSVVGTNVTESLRVFAGSGNDSLVIETTNVFEDLRAYMSSGDDNFVLNDSVVGDDFLVAGNSGSDFVSIDPTTIQDDSLIILGTGSDFTQLIGANVLTETTLIIGGTGNDQLEIDPATILRGGNTEVGFESDSVDSAIANSRLNDPILGAMTKSDLAQSVLAPEQVELSVDFFANSASDRNDFAVSAERPICSPEARIRSCNSVDANSDNVFNEGSVVADENGQFEIDVELLNELDINDINIRAAKFGREASQNGQVFYAADTTVRFETSLGDIDVALLSEDAPNTVRNFLDYIENNPNMIAHRSPDIFVVQSGGFVLENGNVRDIETNPPIENEFNPANSNLSGTLSMALLSGQPDRWN